MLYFKHTELVDRYHVSLKTVHNWIEAAKQGKLDLKLVEKGSRTYIANNPGNIVVLEKLSLEGKKYRNVRFNRVVSPKPEFYEIYSRRQILDIISNLSIHREIPPQYNYMNGGAENWDAWVRRLATDRGSNMLKATLELLEVNQDAIDRLIRNHKRVNVIDVGPGNAYPVKGLLSHLRKQKVLEKYIAIDVSQSMLGIAEKNIRSWFGDEISFEGHIRDISFERFDDVVLDDMLGGKADQTVNIFLFLGNTLTNFQSPSEVLRVVYGSMGKDDLLIYTAKPDTEASRRYFDFNPTSGSVKISPLDKFILDLLGVEPEFYENEVGYDELRGMRYIRIRLVTALTIEFKFPNGVRKIDLAKGETILLLRIWHFTALETIAKFEEAGLMLLQSSLTENREVLLTISGVNAEVGSTP